MRYLLFVMEVPDLGKHLAEFLVIHRCLEIIGTDEGVKTCEITESCYRDVLEQIKKAENDPEGWVIKK